MKTIARFSISLNKRQGEFEEPFTTLVITTLPKMHWYLYDSGKAFSLTHNHRSIIWRHDAERWEGLKMALTFIVTIYDMPQIVALLKCEDIWEAAQTTVKTPRWYSILAKVRKAMSMRFLAKQYIMRNSILNYYHGISAAKRRGRWHIL